MSPASARYPGDSRFVRHSPRRLKLLGSAAVAVLVLSAAVTAMAASAALSVPAQAAPGSQITVAGSGFAASQAGNLTYNGAVLTTFAATTSGAFSVTMAIPASAALGSTGRISAKTSAGTVLATTTLIVGAAAGTVPPTPTPMATAIASNSNPPTTPALTVPALAAPGSQITVAGSGFAAGQSGNLTINGCIEATFAAATDGSFSVLFPIPTTTTLGTGRISAKNSAGTAIATTTLTIGSGGNPTPTPVPTATGTAAPTATPTGAPTPSDTPTVSPTPSDTPTVSPTPSDTPTTLPNFDHVYVIIFENKEYSSVVGSSSAPYINSLIAKYGLATNFTAERHPSEPNYIALTSGGTQGIADDGVYNLGVNNLFDQVTASGRTWHAYQQGYPSPCFTGSSSAAVVDGDGKSGAYVRKHDPAISYTSISGNPAKCANITSFANFDPAAASFEFITPNMINDMHDGTVADGDNFLKAFLPRITGSSAFNNSLVLVTFDEGTTNVSGGGHIMTIAITPNMTPGYQATAAYSHYSLLRTVEQAWGLPSLGNAASATAMQFPW
jgi:hypothetical protein